MKSRTRLLLGAPFDLAMTTRSLAPSNQLRPRLGLCRGICSATRLQEFRYRYSSRTRPTMTTTPTTRIRHSSSTSTSNTGASPLIPAPKDGSGPLLSRRPDRALPNIDGTSIWLKTLPLFIALIAASSLAIFNYQKSSSSTVNSILYALRTNPHARALLGDEIYFASKVPWIRGELSPLQGIIDIGFWVKGTKDQARVKFVSVRSKTDGFFETLEWSLTNEQGEVVQLLDMEGAKDPISGARRV